METTARRSLLRLLGLVMGLCCTPLAFAGITIGESSDPVTAGSGTGNLVYVVTAVNLEFESIDLILSFPSGVSVDSVIPSNPSSVLDGPCCNYSWSPASPNETVTFTLTVGGSANDGDTIGIQASYTLIDPVVESETTTISSPGPSPTVQISDTPDPVVAGSGDNNLLVTIQATDLAGFAVNVSTTLPTGVTLENVQASNSSALLNTSPCCSWFPESTDEFLELVFTVGATANPTEIIIVSAQNSSFLISETEVTNIVTGAPSLSLGLSDSPDPVTVGGTLNYELVISNNGTGPAASIDYEVTLDPTLSYISGGVGNCSFLNPVLSCVINTPLAANASVSIPIQTTVNSLPTPGEGGLSYVDTFAAIISTAPQVETFEETQVLPDTLPAGADLSLSKSAPSSASVGDALTYSLVVRNNDSSRFISEITVIDNLPVGVTPVSVSPECFVSSSTRAFKTGSVVLCDIAVLSPGEAVSLTIEVEVQSCLNSLVNQAAASYLPEDQDPAGSSDPNPNNNSDSATTTCSVLPPQTFADLDIVKSDSIDPVPTGSLMSYTLQVRNFGPDSAENVLIRDILPVAVTLVELPSGCFEDGIQVVCELNQLFPNALRNFTFSVQVNGDPGDLLSNTATVSSNTSDPNPSNNRDSELTRIAPPTRSADVLLDIQAPSQVAPGSRFSYQFAVMNAGVDRAESVVLEAFLDTSLEALSIDTSQGSCTSGTESLRCELGTLANGASASITISVASDAASRGEILSIGTVSSSTPDPNLGNNRDEARTVISQEESQLAAGQVCSRYRAVLEGPGMGRPLSPVPPGLDFSQEGNSLILAGVPEAVGDYRLMVEFLAEDGSSTQIVFTLRIDDAGLSIADPSAVPGQRLAPAIVNSPYGFQLQALGGNPPYRWQALTELPLGLSLYPSGLLAGTPTQPGDYTLSVQVSDALDGRSSTTLRLEVGAPNLVDNTPPLPAGLVGLAYQIPNLVGGAPGPFQCGIATGLLPPGLSLDDRCHLVGVPTEAGDFRFSVLITSADESLPPLTSNRRLQIVADTPIPQGQAPQLTPLPPTTLPVPEQCRALLPPDEIIQQATVDPFGNRYLVGYVLVQEQYDLLLSKFDPEGQLLWEQRFDSGGDDFGYALTLTPDLHIIAAGLLDNGRRYEGLVLKFNPVGDLLWERQLGEQAVTAFYGIVAHQESLYLAGERYNGANFDALLLALDHQGNPQWERRLDSRDTETAYRVALPPCTDDCELLLAGFSGEGRERGWLERRDLQGNRLERLEFNFPIESLALVDNAPILGGAKNGTWHIQGLNSALQRRWQAQIPEAQALRAMTVDFEGNTYVVGRTDGNQGQDGLIWVVSPEGLPLTQARFDEAEDERFTAVMIDPAGRLSVAGQRRGELGNRILLLEVDNGKRFELP